MVLTHIKHTDGGEHISMSSEMDEEMYDPSFPVFGALKTDDLRRDAIDALEGSFGRSR